MKKSARKYIIAGNWKMNPDTLEEAKAVFSSLSRKSSKVRRVSVIIAPPAAFLSSLGAKKSAVTLSAQDVSADTRGAFTGSVSALQAKSAGAQFSIIGHSERRAAGESDEIVSRKVREALSAGLSVILCVGEKERDNQAHYLRVVREQVLKALSSVDKKYAKRIVVAYEPVWAIGKSYDTALKPSDIHEMTIYIRKTAAEILGKPAGLGLPVLYGGSVNFENAQVILREASVDGLLVGRQSLDPEAFGNIIDYANSL